MVNSLTTKKQTTKFSSANFQTTVGPCYIILRIQRLEGKKCSHLIKIYAVCKSAVFVSDTERVKTREAETLLNQMSNIQSISSNHTLTVNDNQNTPTYSRLLQTACKGFGFIVLFFFGKAEYINFPLSLFHRYSWMPCDLYPFNSI